MPLYPTDFPPSYETVMGLRGDSQVGSGGAGRTRLPPCPRADRAVPQATLFDSQLTDGSHACTCDRVPSIVLSGEGERAR